MPEIKPPTQEQHKEASDMLIQMTEMINQVNRAKSDMEEKMKVLKIHSSAFDPIAEKKVMINGNECNAQLMKNGIVILKFASDGKDAKFYFDTHK